MNGFCERMRGDERELAENGERVEEKSNFIYFGERKNNKKLKLYLNGIEK